MLNTSKLQFYSLNAIAMLAQLGIAIINLALVYYLRYSVSFSAVLVGLSASTYTFSYLLFCMVLTSFYQRFKPRYSILSSVLIMALSGFVVVNSTSKVVIFSFLFIYGFGMSMLWPQLESWITRSAEKEQLNKNTAAFNFSWSFGTGISPFITTLLVQVSTRLAFLTAIVVFLFVAALLIALRYNREIRELGAEKDHIEHMVNKNVKDNSTILRYYSWIALFLVYTFLSVVLNIFPLYANEVLKISTRLSGILLFLRGMVTCFAFIVLGRNHWWTFSAKLIFLCQAIYIVLILFSANTTNIYLISISFILFGIIFAFAYSFSIFHSASGALDRGRRMTIHEVILTFGTIIGASCGGYIYDKLSYNMIFYYFAGISGVILALEALIYITKKHNKVH